MKTYFSKRDISICAGRNPIKFQEVTNGYRFTARSRDEENLIEGFELFKRGVIYIVDTVSGVTKCTDALAFLKARWPEAKDLRSRASILAFAESKRISFPDLPIQ